MPKKDRCPTCKCTETSTHTYNHDQGFLEETWTECKMCKRLKHHWSYGCLYVDNWKAINPPWTYRFKEFLKKMFKRKPKPKDTEIEFHDDLPF